MCGPHWCCRNTEERDQYLSHNKKSEKAIMYGESNLKSKKVQTASVQELVRPVIDEPNM